MALKLLGQPPVAAWSWWGVLAPFALAVVWWAWADASGYTRRQAARQEAARQQARINKNRAALGAPPRPKRR